MDFTKQRALVCENGKYAARSSDGDTFVFDNDIQENILKARFKQIPIIPVSIPGAVLFENTAKGWMNLYRDHNDGQSGYCIHLGLQRQVPFRFDKTTTGLYAMRMVKSGSFDEVAHN
jgi:hypothetical protein